MTAYNLRGSDQFFSQQARYDGFGHYAAANEGESRALERVARFR
jgi:hypothetical protein